MIKNVSSKNLKIHRKDISWNVPVGGEVGVLSGGVTGLMAELHKFVSQHEISQDDITMESPNVDWITVSIKSQLIKSQLTPEAQPPKVVVTINELMLPMLGSTFDLFTWLS